MTLMNLLDLIMNVGIIVIQCVGIYFCLTPKYKLYICLIPNIALIIIYFYIFGIILNFSGAVWIKQLVVFVQYIAYSFLFFKDKTKYKFTVAIFSQIALLLDDLLAGCIMATIFGVERITNDLLIRTFSAFVVYIIMAVIYVIFVHFFKSFTKKDTIQHFGMFILFPISQIILIIACMYGTKIYLDYVRGNINSYDNNSEVIAWWVSVILSSIICIVADIILYRVQKENSTNKKLKESLILADYRNELELQYYRQMQDNIEETRKIRHDFYNILSTMNDANKISGELKDEIETALRSSSTASVCENNIVNLIILNKNKICLENGIELDTDLNIPEEISVSKLDLLRVFSNILDNAIEANLKSSSKKRFINLSAKIRDNYLFISAKNPLNSEVIKHNKKYETTKKQKNLHGFGMIILDDIAKKYDGKLISENDKDNFTTLISLKINSVQSIGR